MMNARVVYLGEPEQVPTRDDKELEVEVVKNLWRRCLDSVRSISVALEAFPCDLQEQLNQFMDGRCCGRSINDHSGRVVGLFSIQRFGTSKVGFSFAPLLALWFVCLASIGVYNMCRHGIFVVKALNPVYIYLFFAKNGRHAWSALGGCVLCITGAETMFADLGHFIVRSIQIAFTSVVFPCLLLAYMGQGAYLMKFPTTSARIFYACVPDGFFWPIFVIATLAAVIASQAMISATFSVTKQSMALGCFPRLKIVHTSKRLMGIAKVGVMLVSTTLVTLVMLLIWQTNLFLTLAFPIAFGAIELIYLSATLSKVLEGGWLRLAFAFFMLTVMYTWNYGSVLKYCSEVRRKLSVDVMEDLGSTLGTVRVPVIGLMYNELVPGVPLILGQFLLSLPAIHSTLIFVCIKYVHVPVVPQEERFLFRRICPKDYITSFHYQNHQLQFKQPLSFRY